MEVPPPSFAPWVRAALSDAAAALAARLRDGDVPKGQRAAARQALTRAFEALEAFEQAPEATPAGLLPLLREVDRRATPPVRPPVRAPRIGVPPLRGAVDAALVGRIWAYGEAAERISRRIDAFLEATGAEPLRLFLAEVRPGDHESPEMAFTEG